MPRTLFFSWQSDTSARIGLEFIEEALGLAIAALAEDAAIEKAIRDEGLIVDRDTQGVPGVPPIVDTIFSKIDQAAIFVPDLTFVGKRIDGLPTPNPNVLVEYGWALKSLGFARIIPIMNVAFGEPTPETMPFDMRHLRYPHCTYDLPEGASEERRRSDLARLAQSLVAEIGAVLRTEDLRTKDEKAPFPAAEPKDGQARFRAGGELGKANGLPIAFAAGPSMWLRVMPAFDPGKRWFGTELKELATASGRILFPLGSEALGNVDFGQVIAPDGFGIYEVSVPAGPSQSTQFVVYIFDTGEIWSIDAYHLVGNNVIPIMERYFIHAFQSYLTFLRERLGILPPYQWIAGIEGVNGRPIEVPSEVPLPVLGRLHIVGSRGSCMTDPVVEKGSYGEGADPQASLRPFFVKLYAMCSVKRPAWMDDFRWPPMRQ
jgi:hypothetical protein